MTIRERIFEIIERDENHDVASRIYDYIMLLSIIASLVPLTSKVDNDAFRVIDLTTCVIFIVDYILRWITADIRSGRKGFTSFLKYPFTLMAIVDLLTILPSLYLISPVFKILRVSRIFKLVRVFRFIRYYEPLQIMMSVIRKQQKTLLAVLLFAIFYMLVCALVMFNVEDNDSFATFYDAVYWSCCTLTTVGYGDIYPVSDLGKLVSMISSVVGIALVALPSGVITSGYMEEIQHRKNNPEQKNN